MSLTVLLPFDTLDSKSFFMLLKVAEQYLDVLLSETHCSGVHGQC